jgi:rifampicin phosphotransferase
LPLSISFVKHTYSLAYSNMARHLGMGKHDIERNHLLFENMVYGIYGSLYYNVTAWQLLLYQFPFGRKTSRAITRLLGMEDAAFKLPRSRPGITRYFRLFKNIVKTFFMLGRLKRSYEAICEKVLTENNFENLKLKTRDELILHYTELEKKLGENWQAPVLNGFYLMLFYSLLRKIVFKSRIIRHYPNFINDMLYAQGDIISVKIVRDFQKLITEISKPGQLRDFIQSHTAIDILEQMGVKFPDFSKLVEQYIMHYGVRCGSGELKIETKNYQEDPVQFIELLKTNINQANPVGVQLPVFEYNKVIKQLYKYNPLKRWIILYLTRHTIDTMRDRENYRFIRTRVFAYIRLIFRAFDEKLFEKNRILNRGDSLYLELHELMDVEKETGYIGLIEQRKQEYHTFNSMHRANRYHKVGERFIPVEKKKKFKAGKSIKGTGCCSGIVTGKVKIITADTLSDAGFEDRILVASYFEPGWINLFSRAKGLVSEKGNILSHTAILCREMGIPSIIGAKGIIPACSDDDLIQINGATGEINILKDGK